MHCWEKGDNRQILDYRGVLGGDCKPVESHFPFLRFLFMG